MLSILYVKLVSCVYLQKYDDDFENLGAATMKPRALIIDGPTLITAMADTEDNGCRELLLDFSNRKR